MNGWWRAISLSSAIAAIGCVAAPARICSCRSRRRGLGILRAARRGAGSPAPTALTGALRREARSARAVLVTKANSRATVHRGSYLDYVGVRTFDARGRVTGEHRFLGPVDLLGVRKQSAHHPATEAQDQCRHRRLRLRRLAATMPRPWRMFWKPTRAMSCSRPVLPS